MTEKVIYIDNRKFYYYETYERYEDAIKIAHRYKKKNKSKYFILKFEEGFLFPQTRYRLYLSKVMKLSWT